MIATAVDNATENLDLNIEIQLLAYRSSVQESTGLTLFMGLFGREMKVPLDCITPTPDDQKAFAEEDVSAAMRYHEAIARAYEIVRENVGLAQRRQQSVYDRRTCGKRYKTGDLVLLHSVLLKKNVSSKFHRPWTGPFRVQKRMSDIEFGDRLTAK